MLSATIWVPLIGAVLLAAWRDASPRGLRIAAVLIASIPLVLLVVAWVRFDAAADAPLFQLVEELRWISTLGVAWRLGVDGIALAVASVSALVFVAAVAYPPPNSASDEGRLRHYYAWLLFLDGISLGVFLALDLLLFYVFFDLSLVGMYFLIGRFGHGEDARRAALKFFIYTLGGSLAMLLGIIGLVLATDPLTFDMRTLIAAQPLSGGGTYGGLVLLGLILGLGIKTPIVPFHTWLPPAHVDAPGPASAILAGVLLKMGTYGLVRLPFSMLRETFAHYALPLAIVAVVSIVYGALVAWGQTNLKRRIAYTSVNHMGYVVLGIAAAAGLSGQASARAVALTGATFEMVAHALITGALFLIAGAFWQRGGEYELRAYGGLARRAPRLTGLTVLAAFASLGLPGLAGFVAEFQVFAGAFAVYPWLAAIALLGILITAALFLQMLQLLFFGELPARWSGFADLGWSETLVLCGLLLLVVVLGVYPGWALTVIGATATRLVAG
jgi:NADH-quinone oxidoreductase subunit M